MKPSTATLLALELEFRVAQDGSLTPRAPQTVLPPRLAVYEHDRTYSIFHRQPPSRGVRSALDRLSAEQMFHDDPAVRQLLDVGGKFSPPERGTTYEVRRRPDPTEHPEAVRQSHFHIVLHDGRPVAWAWSIRGDALAEEGTVETVPEFRRRGYGRQALAAWAHDIVGSGKRAFLRDRGITPASESLARSLGATAVDRFIRYP